MRGIITVVLAVFLLCPITAEEKQPKYEPMDATDIIQWYTNDIAKSMLEDGKKMYFISLLTLSHNIPCFDVRISTEATRYGYPAWSVDGSNCVDKRVYQCEDK